MGIKQDGEAVLRVLARKFAQESVQAEGLHREAFIAWPVSRLNDAIKWLLREKYIEDDETLGSAPYGMNTLALAVAGRLAAESIQPTVAMDSVYVLNSNARALLVHLHGCHLDAGGMDWSSGFDETVAAETGLDFEAYRPAAQRLTDRGLAKWATHDALKITDLGVDTVEEPARLASVLPDQPPRPRSAVTPRASEDVEVETKQIVPDRKKVHEALKQRALADIDRVLSYQPSYGGTGAVTEIATSFKACMLRWAPAGSTHRMMAEAIDPFPKARAAQLEQHVRALMATFRRDVEAGQVELVGGPRLPSDADSQLPVRDTAMTATTSIFVSHAGGDAKLAKALIDLVEAGIDVPTGAIRCTSVDGYKLEGGDDASEVLRANLKSSVIVLGILTKTSISSSYVLMELGAAWAFEKWAIPLIGPGATFGDLPGPFKDIHGLQMAHDADMSGLIKTIARETGLAETNNMPKVVAALKVLTATAAASGALEVTPPRPFRSQP